MKFRKKPVEIEAFEWDTPSPAAAEWPEWFAIAVGHGEVRLSERVNERRLALIKTLEGEMSASPGDWIIQGVKGEIYPCKPDIFLMTYEPVRPMGGSKLTPRR